MSSTESLKEYFKQHVLHEKEEASDSSNTKKLDSLWLERKVALKKNPSAASITLVQVRIMDNLGFSSTNAGVSWACTQPC